MIFVVSLFDAARVESTLVLGCVIQVFSSNTLQAKLSLLCSVQIEFYVSAGCLAFAPGNNMQVFPLVYSWIGHGLQSGPTFAFTLWLSEVKTKTSFGFLFKEIRGRF